MRANNLFDICRNGGDWIPIYAKNAKGEQVRIYLDRDRSPRQAKLEAGGRKAVKILQEVQPALKDRLRLDKRDARVTLDGANLLKVVVHGPKDSRLVWNEVVLAGSGFTKDDIVAKWEAKKEDKTSWSI